MISLDVKVMLLYVTINSSRVMAIYIQRICRKHITQEKTSLQIKLKPPHGYSHTDVNRKNVQWPNNDAYTGIDAAFHTLYVKYKNTHVYRMVIWRFILQMLNTNRSSRQLDMNAAITGSHFYFFCPI